MKTESAMTAASPTGADPANTKGHRNQVSPATSGRRSLAPAAAGSPSPDRIRVDEAMDLWRAVLGQAINDALSDPISAEMRKAKRDARAWLDRGGKDFRLVCTYAGLDPDAVHDRWMAGTVTSYGAKTHRIGRMMPAGGAESAAQAEVASTAPSRRGGAKGSQAAIVAPLATGL